MKLNPDLKGDLKLLLAQPLRVVDVRQNSPEWFEMRKTKRTASETPIVMGLSPWNKPGKLAVEKFSASHKWKKDGLASAWGHKHEGMARRSYEDEHGRAMKPAVLIRGEYMASLDGWNKARDIVLEIKCPFSRVYGETWEKAIDGELPDHYLMQVQHQLLVSGSPICHFWVFNPKNEKGIMIEVFADKKTWILILKAWKEFYEKYA